MALAEAYASGKTDLSQPTQPEVARGTHTCCKSIRSAKKRKESATRPSQVLVIPPQ